MTTSFATTKQQLRNTIRQRRRALSDSQRQVYALDLARYLPTHPWLKASRRIAVFLAQDGELDLSATITALWANQQQLYLPVIRPLPPNRLWFAPYSPDTTLILNRYQILEPDGAPKQLLAISKLDAVLFPLVAFDRCGGRLGMGGGFYDRTFAHVIKQRNRPRFIGVAFDQQQVDALPVEPWDIPLDAIATPSGLINFSFHQA